MSLPRIALLGTARAGVEARTGTAIDGLVERTAERSPETRLLLAAGALAIYRRAGYRARAGMSPTRPPAPDESLPACAPGAAAAIRDMLAEFHTELLPEAFTTLAWAGRRLPSSLLVEVLDLEDGEAREAARPVLGERGRWLAAQRPSWGWAHARAGLPDVEELRRIWEEGRSGDRLNAVRGLREVDPDRARDWIAEVWKSEPSEMRLSLVTVFSRGLTTADAPWLTNAASDRTRAVRAAIAALLVRLSDTPAAARAIERADPLLAWSAVDRTLLVHPPERFNPEWDADGLVAKPPRGVGERAWWLVQSLSLVRPAHWEARFGATPGTIAAAVMKSDWALPVSDALARGAALHGAHQWTVALWDAWMAASPALAGGEVRAAGDLLARLFIQMPHEAAESRVRSLIDTPLRLDLDLEAALARFPVPWTEPVGIAVLDAIDASLASHAAPPIRLPFLLRAAGRGVPVSLLDRAEALAAGPTIARTLRTFDLFARQIGLRVRLHQEMRS